MRDSRETRANIFSTLGWCCAMSVSARVYSANIVRTITKVMWTAHSVPSIVPVQDIIIFRILKCAISIFVSWHSDGRQGSGPNYFLVNVWFMYQEARFDPGSPKLKNKLYVSCEKVDTEGKVHNYRKWEMFDILFFQNTKRYRGEPDWCVFFFCFFFF